MTEVYEWEFPEPSHLVDLERVCVEVSNIPTTLALMYMSKLKANAPVVYNRLKVWAKENSRMSWYSWKEEIENAKS